MIALGIRNKVSNYLLKQVEKRGWLEDISSNIRMGSGFRMSTSDDALKSSDVFLLLQDISNQILMSKWRVVDENDNEVKGHRAAKAINNPNTYLTRSEFLKLLTNVFLLDGEVFPFYDIQSNQLHVVTGIQSELDERLQVSYKLNGTELDTNAVRHIKNIGVDHLKGSGITEFGRDTLEGVLSAEKVLTSKYQKGGLLAFLLRLDAHINPLNSAQSTLVNTILDQLEGIDESQTVKMIPLGKGYAIETLKSPIDDEKILAYLKAYKPDLGKFMGVDVEVYRTLMKSDVEKAMMYLHNKSVNPILTLFSEHLTALLIGTDSNLKVTADIDILDFVPYSTKTNIAFNLTRTMIATPDDSRKMLGFNALNTPESSKLYISKDLVSSDEISNATDDSLKGGETNAENGESET